MGRNRRLGQYDSAYSGYSDADPSTAYAVNQGCTAWDALLQQLGLGTPCDDANEAMIQQVPINAVSAGYSPEVVAATQATANEQAAQVPGNDAVILNADFNSSPPTPWYFWLAIGAGIFLVVKAVTK